MLVSRFPTHQTTAPALALALALASALASVLASTALGASSFMREKVMPSLS